MNINVTTTDVIGAFSEAPVETSSFKTNGFRVDGGAIRPVDITVTHRETSSLVSDGVSNFLVRGKYFVGGRLVIIRFGLAEKAKLVTGLEPTWAGVRRARRLLDKNSNEALIEMDSCDTIDVFHRNGVVAQLSMLAIGDDRATPSLQRTVLQPEDALEKRLAVVRSSFEKAEEATGDERVRRQDRNLHELAALLRLTAKYPELREKITRSVGHNMKHFVDGGRLNRAVRGHLRASLYAVGDEGNYWWLSSGDAARLPESLVRPYHRPLEKPSPLGEHREAMTREERAAYERRRDENRAARNVHEKGPSPAADPRGRGKGTQKGKGK